jgi:hypothetical protein
MADMKNKQPARMSIIGAVVFSLVALTLAACGGGSDSADSPTSDSAAEALAIGDAYFIAFNAGDADAVMALMAQDVTFAFDHLDDSVPPQSAPRDFWEQRLVWFLVQGSTLTPGDCTVVEEVPRDSIAVACESELNYSRFQAADVPALATTITMEIDPLGVHHLEEARIGFFETVNRPFRRWMSEQHPEDLNAVRFRNWTSVEEARQNGLLNAQYAQEWASYLDENDCGYLDAC